MVMAYNDIAGISTLGDLALQSDFAPTTPMRWANINLVGLAQQGLDCVPFVGG